MKTVMEEPKPISLVQAYWDAYVRVVEARDALVDAMKRLSADEKRLAREQRRHPPQHPLRPRFVEALAKIEACLDGFQPLMSGSESATHTVPNPAERAVKG